MAKRVVVDGGAVWTIDAVIEGQGWDAELDVRRENWLSFESAEERRFITPLPLDWESWSDDDLLAALRNAPRSQRRSFGG